MVHKTKTMIYSDDEIFIYLPEELKGQKPGIYIGGVGVGSKSKVRRNIGAAITHATKTLEGSRQEKAAARADLKKGLLSFLGSV